MNEEAVQELYNLAQGEGYSNSLEEFKQLISANEEAINNMYNTAKREAYKYSKKDFKTLFGI